MDQIKDSIADQHHRPRRPQHTKIRCFLGCFSGGGTGASEEKEEKLPQRKFKSINESPWFSRLKLRSKKSPKTTVPVYSQSATDEKVNHEKGRCAVVRSRSKSKSKSTSNKKMISDYDELPAKGDDETLNEAPVAGDVLHHGKANKTRSGKGKGKGIFLRNSKSMNHIQLVEEPIITSKQGAKTSSLRKSKSAKSTTTTLVNHQPAGGGKDSQLIRPSTAKPEHSVSLALLLSLSPSEVVEEQEITTGTGGRGEEYGGGADDEDRVKKRDGKNKGSVDRLVGISIIVMVLIIMAVWGKLFAILCSSAWLYFYPLLLRSKKHENQNVGQIQESEESKSKSPELLLLHGNSQWHKNKVVFEGFLQRDHQII